MNLFYKHTAARQGNNNDAYRYFWQNIVEEDQLELWLQFFTSWDRVALWNAIPFCTQFFDKLEQKQEEEEKREIEDKIKHRTCKFKELQNQKMIDEDDQRLKQEANKWEYLFPMEVKNNKMLRYLETIRRNYLRFLLSSHRDVIKKEVLVKVIETPWIKKLTKVQHGKTRYNIIKKTYLNEGENRIPLWFALDREQRISLVKNQTDRQEACFMFLLFMEEYKDQESVLKQIGTQLQMHLDNLCYQKYSLLCQWQAIRASYRNLEKRFHNFREEQQGLQEYGNMLMDKLKKLEDQKKSLVREHENQKRKLLNLLESIKPMQEKLEEKHHPRSSRQLPRLSSQKS